MRAFQDLNADTARLYSAYVTKLSRAGKGERRIYVLCDLHLYRLDESCTMKTKGPIKLGEIKAITMGSGNDQALVLHCVVRNRNLYGRYSTYYIEFVSAARSWRLCILCGSPETSS